LVKTRPERAPPQALKAAGVTEVVLAINYQPEVSGGAMGRA
jgi:hypothetical protein